MEVRKIVLVDSSKSIPIQELQAVADALQTQISVHFAPVWDVDASISVVDELDITEGDWPIYLVTKIDVKGVRGYHWKTADEVPFAKVEISGKWSAVVSHELMEMLVNPYVDRFIATEIFNENEGDESFFLEVAGPSQAIAFSYQIGDVTVSNFFFPSYFDLIAVSGKQYDYLSVITEPRSILEGGYVSFLDNAQRWWQGFNVQGQVFYKKLKGSGSFTLQELNQFQRAMILIFGALVVVFGIVFAVRFIIKLSKK